MDCHRAVLIECGRLKTMLEETAAKLSAQRNANKAIQEDNTALKRRIEELERLNGKQARKIVKLKDTATHVKDFALQLSHVEQLVHESQAKIDQDAAHAHKLLKDLRFAIVKQFSSEAHLSTVALPFLCNIIDNAATAIARMCSTPPALHSHHNTQSSAQTGALISRCRIRQAASASADDGHVCTQPSHLHRKLAEKSRDATLAQRYAKALEARLVLLEAEVTELRSESRLKSARDTRQLPMQGATSFSSTNWLVGLNLLPFNRHLTLICSCKIHHFRLHL
jgi:hypothetical protein